MAGGWAAGGRVLDGPRCCCSSPWRARLKALLLLRALRRCCAHCRVLDASLLLGVHNCDCPAAQPCAHHHPRPRPPSPCCSARRCPALLPCLRCPALLPCLRCFAPPPVMPRCSARRHARPAALVLPALAQHCHPAAPLRCLARGRQASCVGGSARSKQAGRLRWWQRTLEAGRQAALVAAHVRSRQAGCAGGRQAALVTGRLRWWQRTLEAGRQVGSRRRQRWLEAGQSSAAALAGGGAVVGGSAGWRRGRRRRQRWLEAGQASAAALA